MTIMIQTLLIIMHEHIGFINSNIDLIINNDIGLFK